MQVAVVGMGAMGMLYATGLLPGYPAAEIDCICVTRSQEQADELNQHGLIRMEIDQESVTYGCRACSIQSWNGQSDWVIIAVKQTHVKPLLIRWKEMGSYPRHLIFLQNGLGHLEMAKQLLPDADIFAAVSTEGSMRMSNISFRHTGHGKTVIGPAFQTEGNPWQNHKDLWQLMECLQVQGFQVEYTTHTEQKLWEKWLMNCVINPITALLGVENGRLADSSYLQPVLRSMVEEGVRVANCKGIHLSDNFYERVMEVCRQTAANHSSMLQDIEREKETEIDSLNGLLIDWAQAGNIEVPVHQTIYGLIKEKLL